MPHSLMAPIIYGKADTTCQSQTFYLLACVKQYLIFSKSVIQSVNRILKKPSTAYCKQFITAAPFELCSHHHSRNYR